MKSDPNSRTFVLDDLPLHWQMPRADKFALYSLLRFIQPEVSIEIGTYKGGSLQVLSMFSESVHSIDINAETQDALKGQFENVKFHTGRSADLLPDILREAHPNLGFVLVDGAHSERGVMADLAALLGYRPARPLWIACHDSFSPKCRRGMLRSAWASNPHVQSVEVDFVTGVFHTRAFDMARPRSMWGGLCVAHLTPRERTGELVVSQSQRGLYNAVRLQSHHLWMEPLRRMALWIVRRK